jgi:hypothetical protein
VLAGDAVLHRPHAAGVGVDVAAQAGAVLAREHRVDEPPRRQLGVELVELHAGLDHGDVVVLVDLEDVVHPLERHHDAAGLGDAGARHARARAPGGDRDAVLVGGAQDRRHLVGGRRQHHRRRDLGGRGQGLVVAVVVLDGVAAEDVRRPHQGSEPLGDLGVVGYVGCHAASPHEQSASRAVTLARQTERNDSTALGASSCKRTPPAG